MSQASDGTYIGDPGTSLDVNDSAPAGGPPGPGTNSIAGDLTALITAATGGLASITKTINSNSITQQQNANAAALAAAQSQATLASIQNQPMIIWAVVIVAVIVLILILRK